MSPIRRPRRRGLAPIVVALVAAAVGVAGCGSAPVPPSSRPSAPVAASSVVPASSFGPSEHLHGLLLLSGKTGAMGLEVVGDRGERRRIPLPDPDVAWLSTSLDGRALVTTRDGRAFISDPLADGASVEWRALPTGSLDPQSLAGPLAFGTLSPDGSRAAFIAADFASGGPFDVAVLPTSLGRAKVTSVRRPPEGAPPMWSGDRLVPLARMPTDRVGAIVLEPDGSLTDGPGAFATLSIAAGADRVAIVRVDGQVEIDAAAAWLAGAPTSPMLVGLEQEPDGSRSVAWSALSPAGERLALVRTNADGDSVAVTVHQEADGWRQGRRIGLPAGADRAVVAWLP